MVVKFFGNTKGGSTASIDYLLNKRQEAKTARTLQGDPKLTKELIRSIERNQKVCVGCLSFEEANIPEADKYKLMDEFEKTLLPDMQGRYNILWVEHTDKGRLELNFVIPRVDLETGKGLSPYYHASDAKGMRLFQQVHNLENGWSDPKDPSKERTLQGASKMLNLQRDYEQLDTLLHNLVKEGAIQNRTQLIE
ncbi:MAG: mobilization protein, partial [Epsilonproteobacteria bacterium]|nr:mobilization protein [Campylobacterota bacterium]